MESATVGGGGRDMAPESTQHGRGETQPGTACQESPLTSGAEGQTLFSACLPSRPPGLPEPVITPTEGLPTPPTCLAPVQPHLCTGFDSVLLRTRLWVIPSPGAQAVAGGGGGGRLHLPLWSPRVESWHAPTTPVPGPGGGAGSWASDPPHRGCRLVRATRTGAPLTPLVSPGWRGLPVATRSPPLGVDVVSVVSGGGRKLLVSWELLSRQPWSRGLRGGMWWLYLPVQEMGGLTPVGSWGWGADGGDLAP